MMRLLTVAVLISGIDGCNSAQPVVTREALIGTYAYRSDDPDGRASDHNLDKLVLQPDGKYDLVEGGSTKLQSETRGAWSTAIDGHNGPEVLLGHAGYPVLVKRGEIRLLIDNDVGIWYAKSNR